MALHFLAVNTGEGEGKMFYSALNKCTTASHWHGSQDKSTTPCHQATELLILPCLKKETSEMPLLPVKWHISCCHRCQVGAIMIAPQPAQPAAKPNSIRGSLLERCTHNPTCLLRGIMFLARKISQWVFPRKLPWETPVSFWPASFLFY